MPSVRPLAHAVERYQEPLIRYATRIVGDRERARDVVQDTFVRLCERQGDIDVSRLGSWLYAVCHNRAIDVCRHEARGVALDPMAEQVVEAQAENGYAAGELLELLDTLPPRKLRVLSLRYRDGYSYRRISELTGLSVSHVGVIIHKAIATLRRHVVAVVLLLLAGALLRGTNRATMPALARMQLPPVKVPELVEPEPTAPPEPPAEALGKRAPVAQEAAPAPEPPKDVWGPPPPPRRPGGTSAPRAIMTGDPWKAD